MRLSQVNKILLGSCIVVVPLSFYGGLAIKEYYLSKELDKVDDSRPPPHERAMRARIVQLEQERQELLKEGQNLDIKIGDIRKPFNKVSCWHLMTCQNLGLSQAIGMALKLCFLRL
ncbi:uncharacterized protein IAS62_001161 [Cryptococcus decagattii]|uniref:Cytochrome c oxidase assembly protein COX16, mitochondrial n=1 Tax=Cryptococcus decagattii TaxID=1859122 RepID=A0ABZ2AMV2_9TREE